MRFCFKRRVCKGKSEKKTKGRNEYLGSESSFAHGAIAQDDDFV